MPKQTLKVSSKSDASKVAGAIAGFIRDNQEVELQAIGAGATNQAIKAVAIARGFVAPQGIDLSCVPAFVDLMIDNVSRTGVKLILTTR